MLHQTVREHFVIVFVIEMRLLFRGLIEKLKEYTVVYHIRKTNQSE